MKEPFSALHFHVFMSKKEKKKKPTKSKKNKKICEKVDRKPERAVYAKGGPK